MAVPIDATEAGSGFINPLIPIGFEAGKALFNFLGASSQQDPEEIYHERIRQAMDSLNTYFAQERSNIEQGGQRDISLAQQSGAREAASRGYAGSTSAFTTPQVSSISDRVQSSLRNIRAEHQRGIANLQSAGLNFPIFQGPNAFDYLGALSGAAGKIFTTIATGNRQSQMQSDIYNELFKNLPSLSSTNAGIDRYRTMGEDGYYDMPPAYGSGSYTNPRGSPLE